MLLLCEICSPKTLCYECHVKINDVGLFCSNMVASHNTAWQSAYAEMRIFVPIDVANENFLTVVVTAKCWQQDRCLRSHWWMPYREFHGLNISRSMADVTMPWLCSCSAYILCVVSFLFTYSVDIHGATRQLLYVDCAVWCYFTHLLPTKLL